MEKKDIVNPELYSKSYYLTDNEGHSEYTSGINRHIHPKFNRALEIAKPSKADTVLDVGCGRGELLYYCAKNGAKALGIDYSKAAIDISKEAIRNLPTNLQHLTQAEVADITSYNFKEKYTIIFMIEIAEHMHDWQLVKAFSKINEILDNNGRLIIMTPNYYYEKYLSPIKRLVEIPWNLIKIPLRILRGKYKPKTLKEIFCKIFRIKLDRGELNKMMHVNITTPNKIKKLLAAFDIEIRCEDHSKNIISLIMQKWWGRDIVVVATKKRLNEDINPPQSKGDV